MRIRAAAIGLVAALATVPPAAASDGYGCGGTWTGAKQCSVRFQGLPVSVSGHALGPGASVTVSLVVASFVDVPILTCTAEDATDGWIDHYASCGVDPIPGDVFVVAPEATVRCKVSGKTSPAGRYFCQFGTDTLPGSF